MIAASFLQSALDPAGPQAAHIARLWWLLLAIAVVVFVAVLGFLAAAILHRRRDTTEASLTYAVSIAVGLTVVTLFAILIVTVWTERINATLGAASAVTIELTGHQFWWEVQYDAANPVDRVTTANEMHIPVGRPVVLKVTSRDVIHSFWAPNLHGKRDLIPGYTTAIWLQADRPDVFRAQCAEFCGRQHAHMALQIVAEPEPAFERWLNAERAPAHDPADAGALRGRDVFMKRQCVLCHQIRGTSANGLVGPELTHLASRGTLAAGTLPNTTGHLAGWIINPQALKPGSQMPQNAMASDELQSLLAYLETLK
ncbi:MAG TPA: cytochrome c oxidase subunit II [Vicinamibacterales bacterium]|nr:cytochrome c oxidase subunit II [Vicinamibacterales bacterium]